MSHSPSNLLTQWARLFVESLAGAGVRRAVVSPGSRSTPLVVALQDSGLFTIDVVLDERCAAFVALGHAKRSGVPSVCVCTSGSAAAHYFPAIVEADASQTPLLLLSADRPPELQENRAPQTIDQNRLYGSKVRAFFDLGVAEALPDALRGAQRKALQAVAATSYPRPGPVHINFPARKPLEPSSAVTPDGALLKQQVSNLLSHTTAFVKPRLEPTAEAMEPLLEAARLAQRPALVLGPMAPHRACDAELLGEFASRSGWPVFCEVTSQARFSSTPHGLTLCDGFDLVFRALAGAKTSSAALARASELTPDLVLQFGDAPVSTAWASAQKRQAGLKRFIVAPHSWADPQNTADALLAVDPNALLYQLVGCVQPASTAWRACCVNANKKAWQAVAREREQGGAAEGETAALGEGPAIAQIGDALQDGDQLLLGNSMPIRLAENFLRGSRKQIPVVSQRGASGIDGWLSLGAGASAAHRGLGGPPGSRTFAIIGDMTFLHDVGGLLSISVQQPDLTVIVLNNGGGRIFEQLPLAGSRPLEAWTTPHDISLHRLAGSYGIPAFRADSAATLAAALKIARKSGPALIELVVPQHSARATYERIVSHLQADLTGVFSSIPPKDCRACGSQ